MSSEEQKSKEEYSDEEDYSDDSSDLGGLELYSSEQFDANDYDDYELTIIYRHTIEDLFQEMRKMKQMYDNKNKETEEKLRISQQNEQKLNKTIQQAKEIISELKTNYDNVSKNFSEMTERYQIEQENHNKTIEEMNQLKNSGLIGCANMKMLAAVEIIVENGKISGIQMKESIDSARDDAVMQFNLLAKKNQQIEREMNNLKVEMVKNNENVEQEKKKVLELQRKIELLETEKSNLENNIEIKERQITEISQKLEEELSKPKRTAKAPLSAEELAERKKRLEERRKRGVGVNRRRPQPSSNVKKDDQQDIQSSLLTGFNTSIVGQQNTVFDNFTTTPIMPKTPQKEEKSSKKRLAKSKSKSSKTSEIGTKWEEIESGEKNFLTIGMNENGILAFGGRKDKTNVLKIFKHKTFTEDFSLEFSILQILQTKFGMIVCERQNITLVGSSVSTCKMKGTPKCIGESEKGILYVNEDNHVFEVIDGEQKQVGEVSGDPDTFVFLMNGMFFFKDKQNKLVRQMIFPKSVEVSDFSIKKCVLCGNGQSSMIVCVENDGKSVGLYTPDLGLIKKYSLNEKIVDIMSYTGFCLVMTEKSILMMNEKVNKELCKTNGKMITSAALSSNGKEMFVVFCSEGVLYKNAIDCQLHEFVKETKPPKGKKSICNLCGKEFKKGRRCKKCDVCYDEDCMKLNYGKLEGSVYPCFCGE